MKREDVLKVLKREKSYLSEKFGVNTIGLFGSYARDNATRESDIDLVVDMPSSFEKFFDLKYYLEEKLKHKVDLVKEKNLRRFIKEEIRDELLYV